MITKKINDKAELIVSVDDYHPLNMKLAEMLLELKIPATFFIPTILREAQDQIRSLHAMGFSIGCHTLSHPSDMKLLTLEECRSQLQIPKRQIEEITGKPCETLAYPRGRFNEQVIEVAKNVGFKEARTTHVLKTKTEDPFRTPTTIHIYDGRKEYGGRPWRVMADFYLDHAKKLGDFFHIWGHAEEIETYHQFPALKEFLSKI